MKKRYQFRSIDQSDQPLVERWLSFSHVREWFCGQGLENTLQDLTLFIQGKPSVFQHWLVFDTRQPFGYLLTSQVKGDGPLKKRDSISLDILIGEPKYVGKGLAPRVIHEFLLSQFSHVHEVCIDTEKTNKGAVHVYEKAGFFVIGEFVPIHSVVPHYMMRLDMNEIKKTKNNQYVQHKKVRLYTESLGRIVDSPVLLIGGAGAHAHFWTDSFCELLLQAGYRVIRFDHRDTGLSSKIDFEKAPYTVLDLMDDALAVLDSFRIKRAHVVGHSMGGTIAQLLAIHHRDRLKSFTSISVATVGPKATPSQETMEILMKNTPTEKFEESKEGFMRAFHLLNGAFELDRDMAEEYVKDMYERSIHPVGVHWNHIRCQESLHDLKNQLKKISTPGLFIHGQKDVLMPFEGGRDTAKAAHFATFEPIAKMGHMIFNKELERQLATLILAHFARIKKASKKPVAYTRPLA